MPTLHMKFRKRDTLALLAASAAFALTGCGKSDEAKEADAKASDAPKDPAAEAPKAVELPKMLGPVDMEKAKAPGVLPEMTMGDAKAPVTIIEYMSMTCPHCARFNNETFPTIKTKYIDTGKVYWILREFPLDPAAVAAIMLARCAPNNGYFPMVDVLFKQQVAWAASDDVRGSLLQMSKLAGFTQASFEACLTDQKLLDDVQATKQKGEKEFGVASTPTFLVNGGRYAGEMSVDIMSALIDSML
jgi:protein-disulfide isomerase